MKIFQNGKQGKDTGSFRSGKSAKNNERQQYERQPVCRSHKYA